MICGKIGWKNHRRRINLVLSACVLVMFFTCLHASIKSVIDLHAATLISLLLCICQHERFKVFLGMRHQHGRVLHRDRAMVPSRKHPKMTPTIRIYCAVRVWLISFVLYKLTHPTNNYNQPYYYLCFLEVKHILRYNSISNIVLYLHFGINGFPCQSINMEIIHLMHGTSIAIC